MNEAEIMEFMKDYGKFELTIIVDNKEKKYEFSFYNDAHRYACAVCCEKVHFGGIRYIEPVHVSEEPVSEEHVEDVEFIVEDEDLII